MAMGRTRGWAPGNGSIHSAENNVHRGTGTCPQPFSDAFVPRILTKIPKGKARITQGHSTISTLCLEVLIIPSYRLYTVLEMSAHWPQNILQCAEPPPKKYHQEKAKALAPEPLQSPCYLGFWARTLPPPVIMVAPHKYV